MAGNPLMIGAIAGQSPRRPVAIDRDWLTTHGVILGMTGSGKTGLAVVILEELARQHVPLVVCDLKGDLTNLLLTFPELDPADFEPYLPIDLREGDRQAAARSVAERWREGLAGWSLGGREIRAVRDGLAWRVLTPGSGLAPVDLLPALKAPEGYAPDLDPDGARARLDGTTAGLLALVGRGGDPLSDRDHVLLATLLDDAWRAGQDLSFAELIRRVAEPPVARFGVLDAESFYPRSQRHELVLALNTVLASPAFGAWTRGVPLDMGELIGPPGEPRGTILFLAHLGDRERASFLTLLFSTVLSWTRAQAGSESLRVLVYIDEIQGIAPPSASPPTKPPLLTLFKQGRAFGTGLLVATQNPVDLDYKALGNAGLKLVGRLDTDNDRRRALAGLDLDDATLDSRVAGLAKREFLLAGARVGEPAVIASRWALSYLRGPLTLRELEALIGGTRPAAAAPGDVSAPVAAAMPLVPGVEQLFGRGTHLVPTVLVEGEIVYRKASPAVTRTVAGAWAAPLVSTRIAWERLTPFPGLTLADAPPPDSRLAPLPTGAAELLKGAGKGFADEMDSRALEVSWHRALKLVEQEGESRDAFVTRCREALRADAERSAGAARERAARSLAAVEAKLERERLELARDRTDLEARARNQKIAAATGIGDLLLGSLGSLLGGRRRSAATSARRGASTLRQYQEKGRMVERARADVEESEQQIATLEGERARVQAELQADLAMIAAGIERDAAALDTLTLTPARKDITVRRVALAWVSGDDLGWPAD